MKIIVQNSEITFQKPFETIEFIQPDFLINPYKPLTNLSLFHRITRTLSASHSRIIIRENSSIRRFSLPTPTAHTRGHTIVINLRARGPLSLVSARAFIHENRAYAAYIAAVPIAAEEWPGRPTDERGVFCARKSHERENEGLSAI